MHDSSMDGPASDVAMALDYRTMKAAIGVLAIAAAVAAGSGPAMTASLFGALIALALSAGAGLTALLELLSRDRDRVWRVAAWASLIPAWLVFAAMLLHAPLLHLDGLRALASILLVGGALLRAWRWRGRQGSAGPSIAFALVFALMALGATWSGVWVQIGDTPVAAINIACALELLGTGSVWLAEAFFSRTGRAPAGCPTVQKARAAMQMA